MARYTGPKEKIERRLGAKLFLKGERSYSQKSATVRRPYPPGVHGKSFRGRLSEYGQQLRSKQKVRQTYRLLERQFRNLVRDAVTSRDQAGDVLMRSLEQRLDNVIYRLGIGQSRDQARQLVNHGHITVNGKKVGIPSFRVRVGDVIRVRDGSLKTKYFSSFVPDIIKKHNPPRWMTFDKNTVSATIDSIPTIEESGLEPKDIQSIIEYYSR